MTSILRSSKFVRYFSGFARSFAFNPGTGTDASFTSINHCLRTSFAKSLATQALSGQTQPESSLDRSLRRLDQDVRRTGRISRRELEDILEELRHTGSATSTQSLLILRCCGNLVPEEVPHVRTQLVQEIWKTLENLGVPMDVSHYNALLRVYLENEHRFSPTEFLANMEKKGVEPNRVTYQRLIARYCQEGDIEGATRILEFMREKQLPVNESVFNALIMGHSQAGDMESAAAILQVMRQAGLEPSADTYTALLCGHAKLGNIDSINALLEECDSQAIPFLNKDYMDVIYALAVNNHHQHIDQFLGRMKHMAGYSQDVMNHVLRLVNAAQEEVALKILATIPRIVRANGQLVPTGSFYVRQLVKANRPVEKIVALCLQLEQNGMNPRALSLAVEVSLLLGDIEQSKTLLTAMKKEGHPIRQHYFWPLLLACGKKGGKAGLSSVLQMMSTEFGLIPSGETLRDYVVPNMIGLGNDAERVMMDLRAMGISVASAACAVVYNLLTLCKLPEAALIASRYRAYYPLAVLRRPLLQAYESSRDTEAYVSIVRQIYEGAGRLAEAVGEEDSKSLDSAEIVGQLVQDIVNNAKHKTATVHEVLQGLLDQGLSISNSAAERVQEKLGGNLTNEISTLLSKLTSGELVPLTLTRTEGLPHIVVNEDSLKSVIAALEAKGESARGPKRQLLIFYCRNKDIEKAEALISEMKTEGLVLTCGLIAQIVEMYTNAEMLDEALSYLNEMKNIDPSGTLNDFKTIKLATLLVNNDKFQDALKLLKNQSRESRLEDRSFMYNSLCWQLLNTLAEQGRVGDIKEMFQTLAEYKYIDINNVILGPLIKVHLVKEDLSGALAQLEECVGKYRVTPWKNELACKLIQAEDAGKLQQLTDLSTQVHGEINSLYDLVFAFVECGRIRQARKILETPGLRNRSQRLNSVCERYRQEGMVASLEGLVEATRDLSHIDRSDLFYHLLLSYCSTKDPDKALGLWTRMQEEDVQPTDQFLTTLGNFLQMEGRDVPFVIPTVVQQEVVKQEEATERPNPDRKDLESIASFSTLVESLVKESKLEAASALTLQKLREGVQPKLQVFRFLITKLSVAGDVKNLQAIGKLLDVEKKKQVSLDNRLCHANVMCGRSSQYLDYLEKEIDSASEEVLTDLEEEFPRGGAIGLLSANPELCPHFERVAHKYAERGILGPMNVLWMYLLASGQNEAAEKIWNQYLEKCPRVMFKHVAMVAREKSDPNLARKLVDTLQRSGVTERALGVAYSCLIDVLVGAGQVDEGLEVLQNAVKGVCLENFNHTALQRLQKAVTEEGKTFPFKIPGKRAQQSSSSSSSSDEDTAAKI